MSVRTIEKQHEYHRTEAYRAYQRRYKAEQRAFAKAHHRCAQCLRQDAYTLNGRYYCADCAAKNRRGENKGIPFVAALETGHRKAEPAEPKIKRSERHQYGLCYTCGAPTADAEQANGVKGEKTKLCERCLERNRRNARRMQEANKARGPRPPFWPTKNAVESYKKILDMRNQEKRPESAT